MTDTIETHNSDRLEIEVHRQKNCRIHFVVKAGADVCQEAKKKAIREIAKEVSIPGFRKGKAPAAMIEKKFHGALMERWEAAFADICFSEGQKLAHVPILNGNTKVNFKVVSLTPEKGEVSFQFETEPKVPSIHPSEFVLPKIKEEEVSDEKIDEAIRNIRMFYARWEEVKDRPVQEGDFVLLDIDDISQDPPVQVFSHTRFEVRDKKMAEWMKDLVIGKKSGESLEAISRPDSDDSEENKQQFKSKQVRVHIKEIEHAILPPIDDEFARKLGVTSIDELKTRLFDLLTKQSHLHHQNKLRESVADQIVEKFHFDVPATILEQEANHRMKNRFKQEAFARKWNEEYSEEEKNKVKEEIKKQSDEALRLFYIARHISSAHHLSISEEELSPSFGSLLDMMFAEPGRINYKNQSKEQQAIEYSKLMMSKAQDQLIEEIKKVKHK